MNKIKKVFLGIILFMLFSSVEALTIRETVVSNDGYDTIANGTFVIGITKFNSNVVITGQRVSTATYNDVMFNYGTPNYSGVNIYYYASGYWFRFAEDNTASIVSLNDPLYDKLNNSDIYYVNNKEKILEIPYTREVEEGNELVFETDNGKEVEYENGTLYVPATIRNIDIYEKNLTTEEETILDNLSQDVDNENNFVSTCYVNLSDVIEEKASNLRDAYYNKFNNQTLTSVDDEVFYVVLGDYLGEEDPIQLTIGENVYSKSPLRMHIGEKSYTNVPVWKIENGKLLVAIPWLIADANLTTTDVVIGGQTFVVCIYSSAASSLVLSDAKALFTPSGYEAIINVEDNIVDFTYSHTAMALGIVLSDGENDLLDDDLVIFRKASDGTMGLTVPEDNCTYSTYFGAHGVTPVAVTNEYLKQYKLSIPGKGFINVTLNGYAVPPQNVDLTDVIEEKSNALISTFYNKYHENDLLESLTDEQEDVFYVTLGDYTGIENPTELTIGQATYNTNSLTMSIGNKAFTKLPVWKIENGKVLVALTWLSADAMPNRETYVKIGGQTFIVDVYDNSVNGNTITLTSAKKIYGPSGYESNVEIDGNTVDFTYSHGANALGIVLSLNGEAITDENQIIFRKAVDGTMGLTTTESSVGCTYGVYFNYMNVPIPKEENYVREYKLAIPGKGVINVTLNGHAVVPTLDLTSQIATQSTALIDSYYNKYNNGDIINDIADNDVFYVNLGKYLGSANPTELIIGESSYEVSETSNVGKSLYMSIGMNAWTYVPVWKISNGNVLVALTWLSADAMPDQATTVVVGGQTFKINVYESSTNGNTLSITGTQTIYGPAGYDSKIVVDGNTIDFYYTHGAQALGIILSMNDEIIADADQIIFRKASTGHMGLTTTESSVGCTYGIYFNYNNAPISENVDYLQQFKLAIPSKGVINITLNGHAVTSIPE